MREATPNIVEVFASFHCADALMPAWSDGFDLKAPRHHPLLTIVHDGARLCEVRIDTTSRAYRNEAWQTSMAGHIRVYRRGCAVVPSSELSLRGGNNGVRELLKTKEEPNLLVWLDGRTPGSNRFDDTYFSHKNGFAEARHVFLAGNGIPARFRSGFRIAELGFGTGLNMLAALNAWTAHGSRGRLHYVGFEAFPLRAEDMGRALSEFPHVRISADALVSAWRDGKHEFEIGPLHARIVIGDARETLPDWQESADAWFLDGFSPAKNPELWEPELLSCVARRTAPGGTFATYTAAGHVRRALAEAGFEVVRCAGYGRKRHMTKGWLRPQEAQAESI